jgi:hypothetical protein
MPARAAVTLFRAEADEVCVVATAPVRTRIAMRARTVSFMEGAFYVVANIDLMEVQKM